MMSLVVSGSAALALLYAAPRLPPRLARTTPRLTLSIGSDGDADVRGGLEFLASEGPDDLAPLSAPPPVPLPLKASPRPLFTRSPAPVATSSSPPASIHFLHRAIPQAVLCAAGYLFHVCVLSRRSPALGGVTIGWDTAAGLLVFAAAAKRRMSNMRAAVPPWLYAGREAPPTMAAEVEANEVADFSSAPAKDRLSLLITCALLLVAPLVCQRAIGPVVDVLLDALVVFGVPLNPARLLSSRLIFEQLSLYLILGKLVSVRHPTFFSREWVRFRTRGPWLLPVLGGYTASLALFNLVEPINQLLLPHLAYGPEGVVAKLANPSDRSAATLLLSSIAPCIGAPLFEELQSRAFILQALTAAVPLSLALLISGILFGAQHLQIGLLLPLSVTGYIWGVLYVNSNNLLVPMLIHALWNARIFLGSYLGL